MENERRAAEVRIRAERRCGELLIEMEKTGERNSGNEPGPGRGNKGVAPPDTFSKKSLADLGVSRDQSSQWQELARIPKKDFDEEFRKPGPARTTTGILSVHRPQPPTQERIDSDCIRVWGWICNFERENEFRRPLLETLPLMTPEMQKDVGRTA